VEQRGATPSPVIARLDLMTQYSLAFVIQSKGRGILDPRRSLSSGSPKARPGGGDDGSLWNGVVPHSSRHRPAPVRDHAEALRMEATEPD
jgi:hypothetical protein